MRHIVFCLPGAPTLQAAMSWDALRSALGEANLRVSIVRGYNSSVVHARNEILEQGVKGLKRDAKPFGGMDYDYMMWIDSDSVYKPEDFFNLLALGRDIATGLVPVDPTGRGALGMFNDWKNVKYLNLHAVAQADAPFPVDFCGFAFLLVKHGVFESIRYPWFDLGHFMVGDRVILPGEDFRWCMTVKEKGYGIVAHPGVRIGHDKRVILEVPGPLAEGPSLGATRGST